MCKYYVVSVYVSIWWSVFISSESFSRVTSCIPSSLHCQRDRQHLQSFWQEHFCQVSSAGQLWLAISYFLVPCTIHVWFDLQFIHVWFSLACRCRALAEEYFVSFQHTPSASAHVVHAISNCHIDAGWLILAREQSGSTFSYLQCYAHVLAVYVLLDWMHIHNIHTYMRTYVRAHTSVVMQHGCGPILRPSASVAGAGPL